MARRQQRQSTAAAKLFICAEPVAISRMAHRPLRSLSATMFALLLFFSGGLAAGEPGGPDPPPEPGPPSDPCEPYPEEPLEGTTFDGKTVRVYHFADDPASVDAADLILDGALHSYQVHVDEWAFHSADPDDLLEYWVVNCDDVRTDPGEDLKIYVTKNLEEMARVRAVNFTTRASLFELTTHHETNHHFLLSAVDHFGVDEWGDWSWLYNPFAATSETIFDPENEFIRDSPFYENNGADDYVRDTGAPITLVHHQNDLTWGYLYANDGGMDLWHRVFEERRGLPDPTDPAVDGPLILTAALERSPGPHDSFQSAMEDFGFDLLRGTNFEWSGHDWFELLDPVERVGNLALNEETEDTIGNWGLEYVGLPEAGGYNVTFENKEPDQGFSVFLLRKEAGAWTRSPLQERRFVEPGNYEEILVMVLRNASTDGGYRVGAWNDQDPPVATIVIEDDAAFTVDRHVTLQLTCEDEESGVGDVRYANEDGAWTPWEPFRAERAWTLTAGTETKTVLYECRDAVGNTAPDDDTILLIDLLPPIL